MQKKLCKPLLLSPNNVEHAIYMQGNIFWYKLFFLAKPRVKQ